MSVKALKSLLREAKTELTNFVSQSEKLKSFSDKTIAAMAYSQKRASERIAEFLTKTYGPLNWRNPEPGTWHAKHGGYEISIYREAGAYYWQVSCSDDSAPTTFEDAAEVVGRLIGLE